MLYRGLVLPRTLPNINIKELLQIEMLLLLETFFRSSPDQPNEFTGNELRIEAEERRHPGDRLPLVLGCPDVPAGQVVQQERQKHHCFKLIVSIGEVVYGQHQGKVDVDGGQDKVDESKGNSFFDILTSVWCVLCEEFHF